MSLSVRQWSEQEFAQGRGAWSELLANTTADPLFLGWEWQHSWWATFGPALGLELTLLAAYDANGALVGLAPLYRKRIRLRGLLPMTRLQFIGNCWRGTGTIRTEHLEFIAEHRLHRQVVEAFLQHLREQEEWDELVISDLRVTSPTFSALTEGRDLGRIYARQAEVYGSYYVSTEGSFEEYASGLGRNTRGRMVNRRKLLAQLGSVELVSAPCERFQHFFDALNTLHSGRWGRPAFDDRRMSFNRRLSELLGERQRHFSLLCVDGRPVSALYNIRSGPEEYYIRGGFDEQFHPKLALGYLHMGYVIEEAFADPATRRLNLLAGGGKNTQYKEHLTGNQHLVTDVQVIRHPALRTAYRAYDLATRHPERQRALADALRGQVPLRQ